MSHNRFDSDPDLDALLRPGVQASASERLRERLRAQTCRRLRWGIWQGRVLRGLALAGSFIAGMAAWWLIDRPVAPSDPLAALEPTATKPRQGPPLTLEQLPLSGYQLELLAEQADVPDMAQLYRRAGDRFLTVERDYENAIRCYRTYLDLSSPTEGANPSTTDTWLLLALREDRREEISYAN